MFRECSPSFGREISSDGRMGSVRNFPGMLFTPDTDDHKFAPKAARFLGKALLSWNRKSPPYAGWSSSPNFTEMLLKGLDDPKFVSGRSIFRECPSLEPGNPSAHRIRERRRDFPAGKGALSEKLDAAAPFREGSETGPLTAE